MAVGILNPSDNVRATSTRPTATASAAAARRWYSESLHTIIKADDLNNILAQIRTVLDFYSIPDVEGDDTLLRQAIGAAAMSLTGNIGALQGLSGAANKGFYFTAPATMALYDLSSYSRTLLANTTLTAWQTALGISAGSSPNVIALGGLAGGANQLPYFTGVGTMAQTPFTSQARDLLDDASFTAMRTTLGLASGATADISLYAPLSSPVFTGTPTAPTQTAGNSSTRLATTAFVGAAITAASAVYAPLSHTHPVADITGLGALATKSTIANADVAGGAGIAFAKMETLLAGRFVGRPVASGDGVPVGMDGATAKIILGITTADVSGLGALASLSTITNAEVAVGAAIGLGKLAVINTDRLLGNVSGSNASPAGLTPAQVKTMLGVVIADVSGLQAALDDQQPLDATLTALAGLSVSAGLVEQTGTDTFQKRTIGVGASTHIPTRADADARYAAIVHTHPVADITGLGALATLNQVDSSQIVNLAVITSKLALGAVTLPKLADIGTNTLLGNNAALGPPIALTTAQVKTMLGIVAADITGLGTLATLNEVANAQVATGAAIALAKLAAISDQRLVGNVSGVAASPVGITQAQAKTFLAIATADVSGYGAFSSAANSFMIGTFSAVGATTGIRNAFGASQCGLDFSVTVVTSVKMQRFYNTNATPEVGSISTLNGTTSYTSLSDGRVKANLKPLAEDIDVGATIDALQPIAFDWHGGGRGRGLDAQATYALLPEVVVPGSTGDNPGDDNFEPWSIDYGKLTPILLAEVKALRARVKALEGPA